LKTQKTQPDDQLETCEKSVECPSIRISANETNAFHGKKCTGLFSRLQKKRLSIARASEGVLQSKETNNISALSATSLWPPSGTRSPWQPTTVEAVCLPGNCASSLRGIREKSTYTSYTAQASQTNLRSRIQYSRFLFFVSPPHHKGAAKTAAPPCATLTARRAPRHRRPRRRRRHRPHRPGRSTWR